ncbi:putative uncharacterized protein DDB_G0282133 [Panonychus citri]|uniref:putative uncharacterized protein DDB_G0282133 n=1 Tax=Panonychus citri TaxID=50023 RepID=UPI002307859A|nr:putative uncharacterized protein DDB_G0282133 [Panonychus citri]
MMAPMAASINDSTVKFFSKANCDQWLFVLSQYKQVFKIRAQVTRGSKKSGPQDAIKLDDWYQEELPKILQSRKDKHVRYEELVQITKWKFLRTKNRAGLLDLVRINTELAVKQASTKAFKKCPTNLQGAISALVNLKGIGVATASAILCACFPEICPFMADECLVSVPGIENTNYSINEFMAFADQIKACCERLQAADPSAKWTPHKVELTLWTHYWIKEMKLNLLDNMPTPEGLEDEIEETGSDEVEVKNLSKNNGDSHVKSSSSSSATSVSASASSSETTSATTTTTTTSTSRRNGDKVLDEDSNISLGVSNASEVEDEDSRSLDEVRKNNGTNSNRMTNKSNNTTNNNRNCSNSNNNNSAYNCIEDSKDGGGDDNCRQQLITNGDNSSNLSYSNLSSDDLNNSTTDNTADNTLDGPTNLSMISTNNNTTTTTSSSSSSSSSLSSSASTTTTTTLNIPTTTTLNINNMSNYYNTNNNMNNMNNSNSNMNMNMNMNMNSNNININVITSSDVSTTSSCLPPLPLPPHQVAVPVDITEGDASSSIINGHSVISNSNGDDCKKIDKIDSEINCNTVCSSVDGLVVSSNSIKRPLEEITSSDGDGLEDNGSLEKKSRID